MSDSSTAPARAGDVPSLASRPAALFAGSAVIGLLPTVAGASSHREAPLIAADPAVDNTDVYAFSSPREHGQRHLDRQLDPVRGAERRPELLPVGRRRRVPDQHRQRRRRRGRPHLPLAVHHRGPARGQDTFLYNNGPVTSLDDENLLFRQNFTLDVSTDGGASYGKPIAEGPVAPSFTGPASMGIDAGLRRELRTRRSRRRRRRPHLGHPGRGPVLPRPAGLRPAVRRRPVRDRPGHPGGLQRQQHRAEVPKTRARARPTTPTATRSSASGAPRRGRRCATPTAPPPTARLHPGLPARQAAGQRGRHPAGLKDAFNAIAPDQDAAAADGAVVDRVLDPEVPQLIEAIYGVPALPTPRYDLFEIFLTGIVTNAEEDVDGDPATSNPINVDLNSQALNTDAAEQFQPSEMLRLNMSITEPTGWTASRWRRPAARRHRRRHPGLPERPPARRRRRRHRDPGARGHLRRHQRAGGPAGRVRGARRRATVNRERQRVQRRRSPTSAAPNTRGGEPDPGGRGRARRRRARRSRTGGRLTRSSRQSPARPRSCSSGPGWPR